MKTEKPGGIVIPMAGIKGIGIAGLVLAACAGMWWGWEVNERRIDRKIERAVAEQNLAVYAYGVAFLKNTPKGTPDREAFLASCEASRQLWQLKLNTLNPTPAAPQNVSGTAR